MADRRRKAVIRDEATKVSEVGSADLPACELVGDEPPVDPRAARVTGSARGRLLEPDVHQGAALDPLVDWLNGLGEVVAVQRLVQIGDDLSEDAMTFFAIEHRFGGRGRSAVAPCLRWKVNSGWASRFAYQFRVAGWVVR